MKTKSLKKIILALALTCPCMEKIPATSYAMDQEIEEEQQPSQTAEMRDQLQQQKKEDLRLTQKKI